MSDLRAVRPEDGALVIEWRTAQPTTGWVARGTQAGELHRVAYDAPGESALTTEHWVPVETAVAPATGK